MSKRQKVDALSWNVKLSNGLDMPMVGFGTYKLKDPSSLAAAMRAGYRLVDTAYVYNSGKTEAAVGKVSCFVVTKQWRAFHGYEETKDCLAQSLKRLQRDSVDLYLMHWPGPGYSAMGRSKERIAKEGIQCYFKKGHEDVAALRLETWRAMEDAYFEGKCKAIGVSNFSVEHLRKLLAWPELRVRPVVNQIECHPYLQQRDVVDLCRENDIVVQAYASLGGQDSSKNDWAKLDVPPLMENPAVTQAADDLGVSNAAVLLRWAIHKGFAIIPKSTKPKHIQDNAAILHTFQLTDAHIAALDALDLGGMSGRLCWRRDELRNLDFD